MCCDRLIESFCQYIKIKCIFRCFSSYRMVIIAASGQKSLKQKQGLSEVALVWLAGISCLMVFFTGKYIIMVCKNLHWSRNVFTLVADQYDQNLFIRSQRISALKGNATEFPHQCVFVGVGEYYYICVEKLYKAFYGSRGSCVKLHCG